MNKKQLVHVALAAVLSAGIATQGLAGSHNKLEKCYGVAKKGKNDCGTKTHSCAGQAKTNNDPSEWMLVAKGTCKKMGGSLEPGASGAAKTNS